MSLRRYQQEVLEYDQRFGWEKDKPSHVVLHINEELGEISRNLLRLEGYKKEPFEGSRVGQEIVDLLYLVFKLANLLEVDLDAEWEVMWERYQQKRSRRDDAQE